MINKIVSLLADRGIHLSWSDDCLTYKAPKGALTEELNGVIAEHKTAIIEFLKLHRNVGPENQLRVVKRDAGSVLPLSFAQQRLWLLDRINDGSAHYNMSGALRLTGSLDMDALDFAFGVILERHESLRTCFSAGADDIPRQVIHPVPAFRVQRRDLRSLAPGETEAKVDALTREEVNRLFDLSADLMLRVVLLTLDSDEHVLLVTLHHIASDGYQDPLGSFVPRWTVAQILDDALHVTGVAAAERPARITRLLSQVRLSVELAERRPLQLSDGQRQRVAIARAIASEPKLIICDEPASALDVSVQAQVLDLLADL